MVTPCELASAVSPARAEALHLAATTCRAAGRYEDGYRFAKRGLERGVPTDGLFVESWIYNWALHDELAINGYWSGHHRDALDACLKMLAGPALPEGQRARVLQNALFSCDKLPGAAELGSAAMPGFVEQHTLTPPRALRSRLGEPTPKVLLAILAKQKEPMLPLYLDCIDALDYPKSAIHIYIRTNNNTDATERLLREWVERAGAAYASVEFDASDVSEQVRAIRRA